MKKMQVQTFPRILLIAAVAGIAAFGAGCGKADANAKRLLRQAETDRGLADFDLLISEMEKNPKLSPKVRQDCVKLAVTILQEHIEKCRTDVDMINVAPLQARLASQSVRSQIPVTVLLSRLDECADEIRRTQRKITQRAQLKKLTDLQKHLEQCRFRQEAVPSSEDFIMLKRYYQKNNIVELECYMQLLLPVGLVLTGYNEPDTLPRLKLLQQKGIITACSYCRASGDKKCHSCGGTGNCLHCQGTGRRTVVKNIHGRFVSTREYCPYANKCTICNGTGYMLKRCGQCGGKRYHVKKRALLQFYAEQYRLASRVLQEMQAELQDTVSGNTIGEKTESNR